MIEQLLENLVSNGIKYTASGGKVCVTFSKGAGNVRIEVGDTGIGIPSADLPNLYKEFYRSDSAKAIEAHGTGLGLPIVKEIVDKHGGRIMVESEEGLGTIFVVYLPVERGASGGVDSTTDASLKKDAPVVPNQGNGRNRSTLSRSAQAAADFVRQMVRAASETDWSHPRGSAGRGQRNFPLRRPAPAG
jgi:anti-sigma regulatory factor (Ser/Thr protein kinase)